METLELGPGVTWPSDVIGRHAVAQLFIHAILVTVEVIRSSAFIYAICDTYFISIPSIC